MTNCLPRGKSLLLFLLGLSLLIICFSSILRGGLHSDDLHNFQTRSCKEVPEKGIIEAALPDIRGWMSIGRVTPLGFIWMETSFRYFKTIPGFKMLIVTANIIAALTFLLLLSSLNIPVNAAVWAVFFCSVIQFRLQFHDAFSSLNAMYQLLGMLIFSSIIFYSKYLKGGHWFYLVLSVILYTAALLVSEVGVTAMLLFPFCPWLVNKVHKGVIKSLAVYFFITLIYVGSILWIRHSLTAEHIWYDGLQTNYNPGVMLTLLIKQAYAALPLSNLDHQIAIPRILFHQLTDFRNLIAVLILALLAGGIFWLYKKEKAAGQALAYKQFLFALVLMLAPALVILPSVKYQNSVRWGVGYLPVYLQAFGSATLLSLLFHYCFQQRQVLFRAFSYLLYSFGLIALLAAFLFNIALIRAKYFEHEFPTESQYDFTVSGGLEQCEEGSMIVLERNYFWRSPQIYAYIFKRCLGKEYDVRDSEMWSPRPTPPGKKCYLLESKGGNLINMALYRMDCNTGVKDSLLAAKQYKSDVVLIPDERLVLHR
jgi:hypothetical protein